MVEKYNTIKPNANREIVFKMINNLKTDKLYTPHLWYFDLLKFLYDQEIPRHYISNINDEDIIILIFIYYIYVHLN